MGELIDRQGLDALLNRGDQQGLQLTGEAGFLPALFKAVLECGMAAELSVHLGYENGVGSGGRPNNPNGYTPMTVQTEGFGWSGRARDHDASFVPIVSTRSSITPAERVQRAYHRGSALQDVLTCHGGADMVQVKETGNAPEHRDHVPHQLERVPPSAVEEEVIGDMSG
jgi:hypothetical protein